MYTRECKRARRAGLSRGCRAQPWLVTLGAATMACSTAIGQGPSAVGEWNNPPGDHDQNWDEVLLPDHAVHLFTGKILVWGRNPNGEVPPQLWNPRTGDFTPVANSLHNVACGGNAALDDGSILVAGGGGETGDATVKTSIFTSGPTPWTLVGNLNYKRWYSTCTTLGDGKVLVSAGSDDSGGGDAVITPEIYDPDDETWLALPFELTPDITRWYPRMFVVPDGNKVLFVGGEGGDGGNGQCDLGCDTHILDVDADPETWTFVDYAQDTVSGPAVIYQTDQGVVEVLQCGGFPGIRDTSIIDVTDFTPLPSWQAANLMAHGRRLHNLVILANGTILAIGGERDIHPDPIIEVWLPVMIPELFDPNQPGAPWQTMATAQYPHAQHTSAVLLASAKVLVAGGDNHSPEHKAEVFSPPYLFKAGGGDADRPLIGFAPTAVLYDTSFSVILSSGSPVPREEIAKVSFVRLGATTHGFDQDQRYVPLGFVIDPNQPGGLLVEAPAEGNLAPPGYYMLFLISDDGAPCKLAKYVKLYHPVQL